MTICIVYIAVSAGPITDQYASRFVSTFHEYPPGIEDVDILICCNGGPLSTSLSLIFAPLSARMFPRENDGGLDVSAYIAAARGPCANYEAILFLGESNYFHRAGWLKRLVEAWTRHGPGMYGPYASNAVRGHLNTTAFFTSPLFLRQYSRLVKDRPSRMEFEHGENALWRRVASQGRPVRMVTWDGEWEPRAWRMPKNIIWRGDQSNCLMWCNHNDGYANLDPARKQNWARMWDQPFK
jgi:hypothetical protein